MFVPIAQTGQAAAQGAVIVARADRHAAGVDHENIQPAALDSHHQHARLAIASMKSFPVLLSILVLAGPALAGPPPQAAREIEQLMAALGQSGCDFQRNGSWYSAAKGEAHLRRKYEWLQERNLVDSAEQFIERAGSESSFSGRAYQVRCPGKAVVTSSSWLQTRLTEIRRRTPVAH
ncbi:MAG TPA: DUF5329 domain-containing protein [Lysobacter sp.]|jgi:hypothetical protein|nr:DUF5329 domain-containing protein [Lysobacter sp.]